MSLFFLILEQIASKFIKRDSSVFVRINRPKKIADLFAVALLKYDLQFSLLNEPVTVPVKQTEQFFHISTLIVLFEVGKSAYELIEVYPFVLIEV